jgi:hypothetical protein
MQASFALLRALLGLVANVASVATDAGECPLAFACTLPRGIKWKVMNICDTEGHCCRYTYSASLGPFA